jgi:DNA polymerase-3 subunit delta'
MTSRTGQAAQERAFLDALAGGRLHHAWLLAGPKGVGKASFAKAAALRLLAEAAGPPPGGEGLFVDAEHRIARLFAADSHPDYKLVERLPKDAKVLEVPRAERTGHEELARSIRIEQVRELDRLLSMAPGLSPRRAIVIDAVDDLERGGANALLKSLEEPPAGTTFFLVSHAPGRLLPTIRSRCRLLRFQALGPADMLAVLRRELPDADEAELHALARAGEGAPGQALRFSGLDIAGLDSALEQLARDGDPSNGLRVKLARELSLKAAQPRYEAFLERAPAFIAGRAEDLRGAALEAAIAAWEKARDLSASAIGLSLDPQATVFQLAGHVAALARRGAHAKG